MSQQDESRPTLLVTLTGADRPGITHAVFTSLAADVEVIDLEQTVVRGRLTLNLLLGWPVGKTPGDNDLAGLRRVAAEHSMHVTVLGGSGDNLSREGGRAAVVVLGTSLLTGEVARVSAGIADHGANIDRIRRLSRTPVTTLEFDVSGADVPGLRTALAGLATELGIDIAVAPGGLARRGRRLVVLDVDSTLIQDEVIDLLAGHAGREAEVAEITERAMRGELDFATSLRERVAVLQGLPTSVFAAVGEQIRLTPGARTLIRTLKSLGYSVGVVSGGFIEIVQPLADSLGIDYAHANELETQDGILTGQILGPIVDRAEKARTLRRFAHIAHLPLHRTVAIGDGANDLDMLRTAGLGIAFNAKPIVQRDADATVNVPYLDAVLFMLGIARDEIEAELDAEADAEVDARGDAIGDADGGTGPIGAGLDDS